MASKTKKQMVQEAHELRFEPLVDALIDATVNLSVAPGPYSLPSQRQRRKLQTWVDILRSEILRRAREGVL